MLVQILYQANLLFLKLKNIVLYGLSMILRRYKLSSNIFDLFGFFLKFLVPLVNLPLGLIQNLVKFGILLLDGLDQTFSLLDFFIFMLWQFDLFGKLILDIGKFFGHYIEVLHLFDEIGLLSRLLNKSLILSLLLLLDLVQILLSWVQLLRQCYHLTLLLCNQLLRITKLSLKLMLFLRVRSDVASK